MLHKNAKKKPFKSIIYLLRLLFRFITRVTDLNRVGDRNLFNIRLRALLMLDRSILYEAESDFFQVVPAVFNFADYHTSSVRIGCDETGVRKKKYLRS